MSAVLLAASSFAVGLFVGALASAARDYVAEDNDTHRDELVRQWREGQTYGERKGYAEGWTSGRISLVEEQQARRMHPTGSPLSELKAIDAEADDQMRGLD